jgi:hypothetical protein
MTGKVIDPLEDSTCIERSLVYLHMSPLFMEIFQARLAAVLRVVLYLPKLKSSPSPALKLWRHGLTAGSSHKTPNYLFKAANWFYVILTSHLAIFYGWKMGLSVSSIGLPPVTIPGSSSSALSGLLSMREKRVNSTNFSSTLWRICPTKS